MIIKCKVGSSKAKNVDVNPSDHLKVLLTKLKIADKKTKFIYNGETYSMFSEFTFSEIGMNGDCEIFVNNQGLSGKIRIERFI
jgi:hypothetical protein